MITAVVLAGRPNTGRLRERSQVPAEALLPLAGRPLLAHVLAALSAAGSVGEVVVVVPEGEAERLAREVGARPVRAGSSLVENVRAGLAALGSDREDAIVVTGDAALLSPAAVDEFVKRCRELDADVCWAVVPRRAYEAQMPGSRRTFVRLTDGEFTGGNLFYVRCRAVPPLLGLLEAFFAARKQPLRLARLLGAGTLLRFLLGRLSIAAVERRAQELAGIRGRAVILERAEVGFDVDDPGDADYAERWLRERGGGGGAA